MRHAGGITAAALVVAGCAIGVGAAWPLVSGDAEPDAADVTGVWTSPRGGRLEFSGDGRVTAGNITLAPACDPDGVRPEGARVSGTGRWTIGAFPDEAPGAVIDFRPADGPVRSCTVWTVLRRPDRAEMYLLQDDGAGEVYARAPEQVSGQGRENG
ncbi:hypothetical protein ACFWVC_26305 [Streptomyces sp. NPDC058691]|uniref:hypothetical protein n=1 Tax=Streptomyces sp. NPDC058691 TaxID=3346601 RepID=UPI00364C45FA